MVLALVGFAFLGLILQRAFAHQDKDDWSFIVPRGPLLSGLQTKAKDPIYFGWMYNNIQDQRGSFIFLRERMLKDDSSLHSFKTIRSDGLKFGHVEWKDDLQNSDFRISARYVKPSTSSFAYEFSGKAENIDQFGEIEIAAYFYIGLTDTKNSHLSINQDKEGNFEITGYTPHYGNFRLRTIDENQPGKSYYFANETTKPFHASPEIIDVLIKGVQDPSSPGCCYPLNHHGYFPNQSFSEKPNLIVIQKIFKTPFRWVLAFDERNHPQHVNFDEEFNQANSNFEQEFTSKFPVLNFLKDRKHQFVEYSEQDYIEFGKRLLSSLLNGLSYFEGEALATDQTHNIWSLGTKKLLSLIPSKVGFPRGFFWDEGWHEMLVNRFNPNLFEEITEYWFNLQNSSTGWIAREQILGEEAREMSPEWAWPGLITTMNPPVFFLTIERYLNMNETQAIPFITKLYPQLQSTYHWYLTNLKSQGDSYAYHWNGRKGEGDSALDSGLDDFPRALKFGPKEKNVDLQSWMIKLSQVMKRFAEIVGDKKSADEYNQNMAYQLHELQMHLWHDDLHFYFDVDTNGKMLNHIGYIGLLPLCLGIEKDTGRISQIFEKLQDSSMLRSPFGIPSLTLNDTGASVNGYWRGQIWININYQCLKGIRYYENFIKEPQLKAKMTHYRKEMQYDIIQAMMKNYHIPRRSGIFETMSPINGKGTNNVPFTGWSTLALLIMSEDYS